MHELILPNIQAVTNVWNNYGEEGRYVRSQDRAKFSLSSGCPFTSLRPQLLRLLYILDYIERALPIQNVVMFVHSHLSSGGTGITYRESYEAQPRSLRGSEEGPDHETLIPPSKMAVLTSVSVKHHFCARPPQPVVLDPTVKPLHSQ